MVDHLVLFAVADETSPDDAQDLLDSIRNLATEVPTVEELAVGEDFSGRSGEYTHGLFVRFADRDGLATYMTHPAHLAVVEKLEARTTGRIVADYEH